MEHIKDLLVDTLEDLSGQELKNFQGYLISGVKDFEKIKRAHLEKANRNVTVDKILEIHLEDGAVEITLTILKKMKKNQSALELETKYREGLTSSNKAQPGSSSNTSSASYADEQRKAQSEELKLTIKSGYNKLKERTAGQGENCPLKDIYTDLYVVKGWSKKINTDHEVVKMEAETSRYTTADTPVKFSEIFSGDSKKVLTLGIAGIGKTVSVQKFALDWAEGNSNADIDFVFIIPFRELNLLKEEQHSLHNLLLYFYPKLKKLKETGLFDDKCKSLFIFDGLDEFRKPLDFKQKQMSDVTQKVGVDVLVTNLIKEALLPSALVWITSRPAAADQIPLDDTDVLVTEVRGFTDQQKDEYFRKRISDEGQADKILSNIKQSKTLYIMCYIPVLCWIMFTVLQDMMKKADIPKTLTQMYTDFLTIQITKNNTKYNQTQQTDTKKLLETYRDLIVKLAELAFKQLMKSKMMFYEEDLKESSIDVTGASVFSGIFTEILKEESTFHKRKVYCFVHLSFQEFLAAVYVFYCYENKNMKELQCFNTNKRKRSDDDLQEDSKRSDDVPLDDLLKAAVNKAVKSQNGHLDLFLRFLLGISLESNQRLLQGLLTQTNKSSEKTTQFIKELIKRDSDHISTERSINLFLCLYEMNDQSLSREIQKFIKPDQSLDLSPGQCSALACMLLTSEEVLDELDLRKYDTSEEGYIRLIPALTVCRKANLSFCSITDEGFTALSSALKSNPSSHLRDLYLSDNKPGDSGVKLISDLLKDPHCKLEKLHLSNCSITDEGFTALSSALKSNPSSHLRDLNLSFNKAGDSGVKLISDLLKDPHCKLEKLHLSYCSITDEGFNDLSSALKSNPSSHLRDLNLSWNKPGDSGVKLISDLLNDPHCKLEKLNLSWCSITDEGFTALSSALKSNPSSHLRDLYLMNNNPGDSGVKLISDLLKDPHCKLETLDLSDCSITDEGFTALSSALKSNPSSQLRDLYLSDNKAGDSGVKLISDLLKDPHCKLEKLDLSYCSITDEGFTALSSALKSNPSSHLRDLYLSDNKAGDSGVKLISDLLKDPHCKLEKLHT